MNLGRWSALIALPLAVATAGCPSVVAVLESASYPKDVHDDKWTPPSFVHECAPGIANCPAAHYVGECATFEPRIAWSTIHHSAEPVSTKSVYNLEVSCVDPGACSAEVRNGVAYVHGTRSGDALVRVRYVHPVTQHQVDETIDIPFEEVPEPSTLVPRFVRPADTICPAD